MFKKLLKSKYFGRTQAGMTLIELMVVLAILAIVGGISVFDYGKFKSNVSLDNLANDIALATRTAMNYGTGARNTIATSNNAYQNFNGFGIHFSNRDFSPTDTHAGSDKSFIIFNDIDVNSFYEYFPSSSTICNASTLTYIGYMNSDECLEFFTINSADRIVAICPNGNGDPASPACIYDDVRMDIVWRRGYLEPARIFLQLLDASGNPNWDCGWPSAEKTYFCMTPDVTDIIIKNGAGDRTKVISISKMGQISVK